MLELVKCSSSEERRSSSFRSVDNMVVKLCLLFPSLLSINLSDTGSPSNSTCGYMHLMPNIRTLRFTGSDFLCGGSITNAGLGLIASHCALLEHFVLTKASKVTEAGISIMLRSCPLSEFKISGCDHVAVVDVRSSLPLLEHLEISETYTSDEAICGLVASCPSLVSFDVCGCAALTDRGETRDRVNG